MIKEGWGGSNPIYVSVINYDWRQIRAVIWIYVSAACQ